MVTFLVVLQVIVALFMILVVLLQPGNRGGASAALGGAGSESVFGGRGANTFLAKLTFGAATLFMVSNFLLSYLSVEPGSVLDRVKPKAVPAETKPNEAPKEEQKPAEPTETSK